MQRLWPAAPDWLVAVALVGGAILVGLAVHWLLVAIARRTLARSAESLSRVAIERLRTPSRWLFVVLALAAVQPALPLGDEAVHAWTRIAGLAFPALVGWIALAVTAMAIDVLQAQADISVADNLQARRNRTRLAIFHRIAKLAILFATVCLMLMSIPAIRAVGVTLIASAGLAALAVGAAAQPALKNLIGGIQMAFTEPIRIDDVVIVDGEGGGSRRSA